ncbi:hypothetical protein [Undibacterium sp.]|uniref:hypothetical protein n=1 Tax=Undibacterium sp. TaxID=1914977 RepID=UPI00272F77A1|nr:hypothetical protein [Undibacterium sp.]MDP1977626.1 hypothetical protein [Undibacterium sp.]
MKPYRSVNRSEKEVAENFATRPIRDLLLQLPHLTVNEQYEIDYAAANPVLLSQFALNGEAAMLTIHRGISAIGLLIAHSSPEIESREIPADATEAIGWLLGELGEFAAVIHSIAAACRRSTVDFEPGAIERFPNAKP